MQHITKTFGEVVANDHVDLDLMKGEIHALLGENGAGKSTLMNVLYGLYQPDEGHIYVRDQKVSIKSPKDALELGIGMIHQHFALVLPLTVAENIILGTKVSRGPISLYSAGQTEKKLTDMSKKYGLDVDPKAKIWQLSAGEQERVEILKALYRGVDVLILDEPTAVLTLLEVKQLFTALRNMTEEGHSIIFISHKLNEVMEISDRVTVLRDGRVISTVDTNKTSKKELGKMMVGREIALELKKSSKVAGKVLLEVKDLEARNDKGLLALKKVSFDVRQGEILGLAGVSGNGQVELAEVIAGIRKTVSGRVFVGGRNLTDSSPKYIIDQKLAYIPEDRMLKGSINDFSVAENMIIDRHSLPPFANRGFLRYDAINQYCENLVSEYDIKTPSASTPCRHLSGGNLQKVLLVRKLSEKPQVIVAALPTRGLDVGATEFVQLKLLEQREEGAAILLISDDLDEILSLSDRIAVIYEGEIMGILTAGEASREKIGLMMGGLKPEAQ